MRAAAMRSAAGVQSGIQRMRDVIRNRKDRDATLRISEFGWGSGQCSTYCAGPEGQAQMLTEAMRLFERKRKQWKIEAVNWFSWQDAPFLGCRHCPTTGLFTVGRQPKPSWEAFVEAAAPDPGPRGAPANKFARR